MTLTPPNPASAAGAAGSGNAVCFGGEQLLDSPSRRNLQDNSRGTRLRVVAPSSPPRPRRIEVHIVARDGPAPIGRTRALRLTESELDWLIDAALRLEGRR
jgi:hypothetical protein